MKKKKIRGGVVFVKIKSMVMCLIFSLTIFCTAFAGSEIKVDFNKVDETLLVHGDTAYAPGSRVNLLVLYPTKGLTDIKTDGQNNDGVIFAAAQKTADRFGGIEFEVSLKEASKGIFSIYLSSDDGTATYTLTYSHVPGGFEATFLTSINATTTVAGMKTLLTGEDAAIFLREPGYPAPVDVNKIYEFMVGNRPYASFEQINIQYANAYVAALFSETKTAQQVAELVGTYGESDIKLSTNPQMKSLYQTNRLIAQIHTNLAGFKAVSMEALRHKIYDETILTSVEKIDNWSNLAPVINGANTYLTKVDYPRYGNYADKINKQIAGKRYGTVDLLQSAINSADISSGSGTGTGTGSGNPIVDNGTIAVPPNEVLPPNGGTEEEIILFKDQASIPSYAKVYLPSLKMNGIVSGDQDGNFNPNNNITRAELAKILVCAFQPKKESQSMSFSDVKSDDWFYPYVSKAIEAGYFKGIAEDYFGAGENVTRQDMAVVMERICRMQGVEIPSAEPKVYLDAPSIADYAAASVEAMGKLELMVGSDSYFSPADCLTRAQGVKIIGKLLYELS